MARCEGERHTLTNAKMNDCFSPSFITVRCSVCGATWEGALFAVPGPGEVVLVSR